MFISRQQRSSYILLTLIVALLSISMVASQRIQPPLAKTTGIDPDILKQLPIKPQSPKTNLLATTQGASNQTVVVQSKSMLYVVNPKSTELSFISKATGMTVHSKLFSDAGWKGSTNKIQSTPCYNPTLNTVYFVAPDLNLYGFDGTAGTQIFKFKIRLDDFYFTPVCAGNVVAFNTFNNGTNTTQFSGYYTGATIPPRALGRMAYNITITRQFSRIVQFGSKAYFVQNPWSDQASAAKQNVSFLTVANIEDGLITYNRSMGVTVTSSPYWVADDEVYFGAADATSNKWIYRWNMKTTKMVWRLKLQPQGTTATTLLPYPAFDSIPVTDNDFVYVPTRYGELYALDRLTGKSKWSISKKNMTNAKASPTLLIGNNLVVGSDKGYVYVINKNLTTVSYYVRTSSAPVKKLPDIINILQDGNTVYYVDTAGSIKSLFIDYDTDYEPIFRQNHRYFDMADVKFTGSTYLTYDNYSSEQIFDQYFNRSLPTTGFNSLQSINNTKLNIEEVLYGSLDYSIHDVANVSNYANYFKFSRKTNAPIVATAEISAKNMSTYVGSLDNVLYGVGITNFQYWYLNTFGPILCQPILLESGVLAVTSSDGYVYGVDPIKSRLDNITLIFQAKINDWVTSTPLVYQGSMYFGSTQGGVFSLDTKTGEVASIATMKGRIFGDGSVDNLGYIYYGDILGNVAKFSRSGKQQWTKALDGPIYGSVQVKNTTVAVGTTAGSFYFLDTKLGEVKMQFKKLGSLMSNVVSYNETFYVGSLDGWMYAFNSTDNSILNAQQLDSVNNITSISTTQNFAKDKLLYITTSSLKTDPKGGFIVDPTVKSTVYAVIPPGATKKYTPINYLGPIVPQPDYEELAQQTFVGPPLVGLDYLKIPAINAITQQNTYDIDSVFTASQCTECSDALGRDVGKWIMGTLFNQAGIDSQYVSTSCYSQTNNCFKQRKLMDTNSQYQIPLKLRFAFQDASSDKVWQTLQQQANNVTSSETLKQNYGGNSFDLKSINPAPVETIWKKNERYFIVVICVGGVVILVVATLCIQAKCRKPNQRRFKKMLKNVGPLGPVMLQGNKIQQNKPLLATDDNDNQSRHRSDHVQSDTVQEEDEIDEETGERYSRNQHYNEPPAYKL